MKNDFQMLI